MLERKKTSDAKPTGEVVATMDKKNVSMNDVAIAAGVSLKTVSRVINEPNSVRESTRDKVHSAMEALGFRTNFAARSLKLGRYGWLCSSCRASPWTGLTVSPMPPKNAALRSR